MHAVSRVASIIIPVPIHLGVGCWTLFYKTDLNRYNQEVNDLAGSILNEIATTPIITCIIDSSLKSVIFTRKQYNRATPLSSVKKVTEIMYICNYGF